ncbi:SpoIIE family protein phosphatase [Nonomuraea roseoviolacea]|uniref:Serine phosphatase RsbU (Regulator of sigma subunit) n=1 Tax=Nonomuraea roseoviolacea subsp. carminata TaxID=160689 RepID=A0ABT1K2E0_9ACTN|nr:SpoIIE family protein phosphatase [Nonomuraea roseoviolacea]MCP2347832.1 serine phosphatase RsbU (regulator of sigma subunit) [Nonomuraea roseoviolacea subsp. carminata]
MHDPQQPADEGTRLGRLAATVERLRREVREAHAAADGRALIELAKGILVERLGCNPAEAARQLSSLAEQAGLSQLELAADIVNQAAQDRLTEAAAQFVSATVGRQGSAADAGGSGDGKPSITLRLRTAESGVLAADDTQAVSESLLQHALAPLGATAVAVWAAGTDGSLTLAGAAGFAPGEAGRWRYVPPGVVTPARQALEERGTVWFGDVSEVGLPSIGHLPDESGARVAVPTGTGGRVLGVLEIVWPHPLPPQPQAVQRQVEALAELIAHTLEDHPETRSIPRPPDSELLDLANGLHDPTLILRPHLDADGNLADFRIQHVNTNFVDFAGRPRSAVNGALLLEAYPLAAGEGGLFEKVERVHATGEPFRAERMPLTAIIDQVPLTAVASVSISRHGDCVLLLWRVLDEAARVAGLLQHAQRLGRMGGFEENLVNGEITWNGQLFTLLGLPQTAPPIPLQQLPAHAHPDDAVALGRFLRALLHHQRPASTAFRLQRSDGVSRHIRVVAEPVLDAHGRLLSVRGAYQDISAQHWTEVALAATRDQLAHTEQQAAERNRLALQLQQAIMPPTHGPIDAFDLRIGVRYRPAEEEHLVGGDWYDCVVLPSKQVLLSLGDVAGHGIEAATGMVVLRNALRGLATTGAGPAQLLTWLNLVAHHLTEQVTATAVCALFDPETRVLRWARAGHFPPIMLRDGEASELPLIEGVLLGALSEARFEEGSVQLHKDDVLLMYTDGLIERKDRSLEHSQRQLLTVATAEVSSLEQRLDHLLTYSKSDTDDDTCVIGIQLR